MPIVARERCSFIVLVVYVILSNPLNIGGFNILINGEFIIRKNEAMIPIIVIRLTGATESLTTNYSE